MAFIDEIKNRAKKDIKRIILPESDDDRTLKATSEVLKQKFAEIILIGNRNKILKRAKELSLDNIEEAEIVDPNNSENYNEFVEQFYELRKHKGMTIEKSKEFMLDNIWSAGLKVSDVEWTAPETSPSAFFMMIVPNCTYGENGVFLFSDSGLNENPDSDALSEIAISSSKSFELLTGKTPKIAMLSYSSHGSAKSELTDKVINATNLVKEKALLF